VIYLPVIDLDRFGDIEVRMNVLWCRATLRRSAVVRLGVYKVGLSSSAVEHDSKRLIYKPIDPFEHPESCVSGVSKEDVSKNPEIAEFFRLNFGRPTLEPAPKRKVKVAVEFSEDLLARWKRGEYVPEEDVFANSNLNMGSDEYIPEPDYPYYQEISNESSELLDPRVARPLVKPKQRKYPRNIRPLKAYVRTLEGSRACRYLREKLKLTPGIIYGSDPTTGVNSYIDGEASKLNVMTPHSEIHREKDLYRSYIESRVYQLTVWESPEAEQEALDSGTELITPETEGVVHQLLVLPADYQKHPVIEKHICINYLRYHPLRPINIPIACINEEESPALKRGGFVVPIKRTIPCLVEEGYDIPEAIDLDCKGLQVKNTLRLNRLIFPEGVRYSTKHLKKPEEWLHGSIFGKSGGPSADETETPTK